jgi:PAS domain S-box-containing protein
MELDAGEQRRQLRPALVIMVVVAIITCVLGSWLVYRRAYADRQALLTDAVGLCRRMVDASLVPSQHRVGDADTTEHIRRMLTTRGFDPSLGQIREVIVGHREADMIRLFIPRPSGPPVERMVPWNANHAEPMRRAVRGENGVIEALDYAHNEVLASYTPLSISGWGAVAKVKLAALEAFYWRALTLALCLGVLVALGGACCARWACNPLIRRVAAREARSRAVIEHAVEGIITIDRRGIMTSVNPAACTMLGYSAGEMIGQNVCILAPPEHRERHDEYMLRYLRTGQARIIGIGREVVGVRKDGSEFPMGLAVSEFFVDGEPAYAGMIRDLSAQRSAEAALAAAQSAATVATQAKCEFLANASHEIRTPMTAILGFAETLADPDLSAAERADASRTMRRNGDHLLAVLNDILDLSKIEAGRLNIERTTLDPLQLIHDVQSLMQVRAAARQLRFVVQYINPIPVRIESDAARLKQILVNLIENAFKFTAGDDIKLLVQYLPPEAAQFAPARMQFEIATNAGGLPPVQAAQLFAPRGPVDGSATPGLGGAGLGLTISKRLAGLLGGDIVVESSAAEGSLFRIWVDAGALGDVEMYTDAATAAIVRPASAAPADVARLDNRRVLLAEDGIDNQRLISHVLRKAGAEVTIAENGRVAVDLALAARARGVVYDVVVMDMQMPVMDGYEATRSLRESAYSGPIVALTAYAMAGDHEKCLAAGCDEYASKPIDLKHLLALLNSSIAHHERDQHSVAYADA